MIALLLAWLGLARAETDVATHLAQAELFARRHWYEDAANELDIVLDSEEGRTSFEANWLAAQVAWEILDIDWALRTARRAAELAPDPARRDAALALVDSYEQQFGFLVVEGPYAGMATRMQLELEGMLFDPELKRFVNRVALAWRERTPLPVRQGLPAATYRVNGQEVAVKPGETVTLRLPMAAVGARGIAALQVARLEVGAGMGFFLGPLAESGLPGPDLHLAWTQPVGGLLLGLSGDLATLRFAAPDHQLEGTLFHQAVGLRVGRELPTRLPLGIRPSLSVRYLAAPGIPLDCSGDGRCAVGGDGDPDRRVYATGRAVAPGLELVVEYRQAGRTTAFGTGMRAVVEQPVGWIPADQGDGAWALDGPQRWTATGIRLLGHVSVAF